VAWVTLSLLPLALLIAGASPGETFVDPEFR
jgi:hypothetical protein